MDLGEFNDIKTLPGFLRAEAATLEKAWAAGLKFAELAITSDAIVHSRIDAVTRLEASSAEAIAAVNASACGASRPRKSLKRLLLLIIAVLQRIRVCKILTAIATKTCVFQQRCRLPISCLHAP